MSSPFTFTSLFPFCGLGAGARGFLRAAARLGENEARFANLGGIDNDPLACADFRYLTGAPALERDIHTLMPNELRAYTSARSLALGVPDRRPDVVFSSPPCKGYSRLLSKVAAASEYYQQLNRLVLDAVFLIIETWRDDPPPALIIENVPGIASRGKELLGQVKQLLTTYGYVFHESTHNCGELGGLGQNRIRYLLIARRPTPVPAFIHRPPRLRVKGCGEILETLPLPETPGAGDLHKLPGLSALNWLRLALIPAGGDWRDLPASVPEALLGQTGKNASKFKGRPGHMGVLAWDQPSRAVYRVTSWDAPAHAVTGARPVTSGGPSVADPRVDVAGDVDPRFRCTPRGGMYGVLSWQEAAATIIGNARIDTGPFAVADPRKPLPKNSVPIIVSADGTWHRPLTRLELAVLQGLPARVNGEPLRLATMKSIGREGQAPSTPTERIGNAVPEGAARAIGESILTALLAAALGTWMLSSTGIWVRKDGVDEHDANAPWLRQDLEREEARFQTDRW